jgi:hypothetical protein
VHNSLSITPWRNVEEREYSSTILDLGNTWKWMASFTLRLLGPPGENPTLPIEEETCVVPKSGPNVVGKRKIPWRTINKRLQINTVLRTFPPSDGYRNYKLPLWKCFIDEHPVFYCVLQVFQSDIPATKVSLSSTQSEGTFWRSVPQVNKSGQLGNCMTLAVFRWDRGLIAGRRNVYIDSRVHQSFLYGRTSACSARSTCLRLLVMLRTCETTPVPPLSHTFHVVIYEAQYATLPLAFFCIDVKICVFLNNLLLFGAKWSSLTQYSNSYFIRKMLFCLLNAESEAQCKHSRTTQESKKVEVITKVTYVSNWPPLWTRGQSSWLRNGDVLCFLWGTNWIYICYVEKRRPPLWSRGQSSWLQIQRSGFDLRRYQIFWEVVGRERSPLSLVSTTKELLEWKSSGSGLEHQEYGRRGSSRWPRGTLYPQKLTLTSPTSGGRWVGIVRSRTQPRSLFLFFCLCI